MRLTREQRRRLTPEQAELLEEVSRPGWVKEEFARKLKEFGKLEAKQRAEQTKRKRKRRRKESVVRSEAIN
jgi:hypothetical protein